jgi:energy-converting hydrogenase Eha subunit A
MRGNPVFAAVVAAAFVASVAAAAATLPPIASHKTTCPKKLWKVGGIFPVTVMVAAEKGQHPSATLLGCTSADAIALAGKKHYLKPPYKTGAKITVGGATYTLGVGGPNILPATSGPVYGWFGNGIEVLLIVPSGP